MLLPRFQYHSPSTIKNLLRLKEGLGDKARFYAGGTDLLSRMKLGLENPEHLLSMSGIKSLSNITLRKKTGIEIGAMARLNDIVRTFDAVKPYSAISQAAYLVASKQIRNMATIGGNILQNTRCMFYNRSREWQKTVLPCHKRGGNVCHAVKNSKKCFAVYQGDIAPVLIALKARAYIYSPNKTDDITLEKIFSGDSKRPFRIDENSILGKIILPQPEGRLFSTYKKYRIRDGLDFPLAGVAVALEVDNGSAIAGLKICLTGVSSSPVIVKGIEEIVASKKITPDIAEKIAKLSCQAAHPVDNVEGFSETRRSMVRQMVYETILEAIELI